MKTNGSKTANKWKGLIKHGKASPGLQTITSMFKRQMTNASVQKHEMMNCSPAESVSCDDDVEIIKVETESSYFSQGACEKCSGNKTKTGKKLSLKRSSIKELSADCCCSGSLLLPKVEDCVNMSSQKENSKETENVKLSRKLNLRKRKSDTPQENDSKKNKFSFESDRNLSPKCLLTGTSKFVETQKEEVCVVDKNLMSESDNLQVKEENKKSAVESCSRSNILPTEAINKKNIKRNIQHVVKNMTETDEIEKKNKSTDESKQVPSTSKLELKMTEKSKQVNTLDENEHSVQNEDLQNDEEIVEFRTPYYLENFRTVLSTVFEDENNLKLYNSDDMDIITTFNELTESAQKLYLRLFCRKWSWLPLNKIKYPGIADDLYPVVEELVEKKLFATDKDLQDLISVLKMLSGGDVKTLGKLYHLNTTSQNKADIIDLLIKKTKENTIGSMFKMGGNSPVTVMINRAKKLLGTCICLAEGPRNVFARTMMLFSLTDTVLDEDSSGQTLQLFQMLRVNIGQVTYPTFTVNKKTQIFPDRKALLRFCEASLLEFDILTKLERNKYIDAYNVYEDAVRQFNELCQDKHIKEFDKKLPVFLRPYTACGVYTRILNQGVEILQRRKEYQSAVDLLKKLLSQDHYCQHYRGHWWERLALNYDIHLKNQDLALQAAQNGLADKLVKTGRRLALYQRAEKICTSAKSKFKSRMKDFHHDKLLDLPVVTIDGQTLSDCIQGQKYKFMIQYNDGYSQTDTDDIAFCSVEEVVLDHYKHNGFTDGIHAEGSVISCLFGLFFWDIIYLDVPDVFHSQYQSHPLDFHTEEFYINRQKHIDDRLELIQNSSVEDLKEMVKKTWDKHEGTIGLNWDRFNNLQHVQDLVECIGGNVLSGVLGRFAKDPRHTRSGFPDLTLWNTETKHLKICEVKGPGDKLSHKQIMWLDFLLKLGVDAEVCHVKAVGSKRLKKTTSNVSS